MRKRTRSRIVLAIAIGLLGTAAFTLAGCAGVDALAKQFGTQPVEPVANKPVINKFTPASAKAGATVTLTGVNFGAGQGSVAFQDKSGSFISAPVTSWKETEIVITVPLMPSGAGPVLVGLQTSAGVVPALPADFTVAAN